MLGNGPNYSVRIGRTNQDAKEVAKNSMQALGQVLAYTTVHDDIAFDKVVQVCLKAGSSPELPVFNQLSPKDIASYYAE